MRGARSFCLVGIIPSTCFELNMSSASTYASVDNAAFDEFFKREMDDFKKNPYKFLIEYQRLVMEEGDRELVILNVSPSNFQYASHGPI